MIADAARRRARRDHLLGSVRTTSGIQFAG
jgi:hypothetical protein